MNSYVRLLMQLRHLGGETLVQQYLANLSEEDKANYPTYPFHPNCPLTLGGSFIWSHTPEGHDFWAVVETQLYHMDAAHRWTPNVIAGEEEL